MYSEFQQIAVKYSKLFAVVSAIVVLLSWLIENLIVNKLNDLKDSVQSLEEEKINSQRQFHVESKLLEVYQVAASARHYAELLSVRAGRLNSNEKMAEIVNRLERIGVTRGFITSFILYGSRHSENVAIINPPDSLKSRVGNAFENLIALQNSLLHIEKEYKLQQKAITGSEETINPNIMDDEKWSALEIHVREYRSKVDFEIAPKLIDCANEIFRSYDELFVYAKIKVKKLENTYKVAKIIQITLFVIGSMIAIYGTYLEAISPKK